VDAITQEPLPAKHVCFFPPSEDTPHCFSLETLRKIALTTQHPVYREDLTAGTRKQSFLQPPHFRTAMSDNLLDQIASRFGREALDLHGDYYHRKKDDVQWGEHTTQSSTFAETETFGEQVKKYLNKYMGGQDIYACPLCYIVAHKRHKKKTPWRRSRSDDSDSDSDEDMHERYPTEFSYDPMTVLGSPDDEEYQIASCFCFKRASEVKKHLRQDHNVDTKVVTGNDFYARFKVSSHLTFH
jgi:hypothetical protein